MSKYRLPNGTTVHMVDASETGEYNALEYALYIRDAHDKEIVSWTGDEWIESPDVVASMVNAIMKQVATPMCQSCMDDCGFEGTCGDCPDPRHF